MEYEELDGFRLRLSEKNKTGYLGVRAEPGGRFSAKLNGHGLGTHNSLSAAAKAVARFLDAGTGGTSDDAVRAPSYEDDPEDDGNDEEENPSSGNITALHSRALTASNSNSSSITHTHDHSNSNSLGNSNSNSLGNSNSSSLGNSKRNSLGN